MDTACSKSASPCGSFGISPCVPRASYFFARYRHIARDSYKMNPSSSCSRSLGSHTLAHSAATHNVGHLAKWLKFLERWCFMFTFIHSNIDELIWYVFFSADFSDESDKRSDGVSVESEDHSCEYVGPRAASRDLFITIRNVLNKVKLVRGLQSLCSRTWIGRHTDALVACRCQSGDWDSTSTARQIITILQ